MKIITRGILLTTLLLAGILSVQQVKATDGYFSCGYGPQSKGLAGAGIAWYQTSLINGNPAGLVQLGRKYQFGVALFNPNREYTVTGAPSGMPGTFGLMPGNVESDSRYFPIPTLGANWMLGEKSSLSISMFGNGGMNTDYPTMTFGDMDSPTTGVNLMQLFTGVSYSRKLAEKHSIGITGLFSYQMFEAKGLGQFKPFSSAPDKLTNNGMDGAYGYGVKIGYMGELVKGLTLGASYQTMLYMSEFDDYAGLFAEQGDFNIPSTWTVGLALKLTEKWTVMADVKQINYTDVASVSNPMDPMALPPAFLMPGGDPANPADYMPNENHVPLGADKGAGFGWDDMTVYKFGTELNLKNWILRAGYSHGKQPIPNSQVLFNILAPGTIEDQVAFGFTRNLGESGKQVHVSFCYSLPGKVKGYNPMDFDAAEAMKGNMVPNQTIELEMNQLELEVAFSF